MDRNTIVAQATPLGRSGIAVVRLSGPESFNYTKEITHFSGETPHHTIRLLTIYDNKNRKIDEAIFAFYQAPRSYTGEDVVEISCHGNPQISERIINRLTKLGASLAQPGEYTRRAFLNGKIDLSQAESLALLISSRSKEAAEHQLNNLGGAVSNEIKKIRKALVLTLSLVEFELDVSEEEASLSLTAEKSLKSIKNNIIAIERLMGTFAMGSAYSSGIRVSVVGAPNVGKSTLTNRLLGSNRSIVDKKAGTTRDTIATDVVIAGIPTTIVDTAGIRETSDRVEAAGVDRAMSEVGRSALVLNVFTSETQTIDIVGDIEQIYVYNKVDLQMYSGEDKNVISVSALKNIGIRKLLGAIEKTLKESHSYSEDVLINTERQKKSLEECSLFLNKADGHLSSPSLSLELASTDIRSSINSLDTFLGRVTNDDILNQVFSSFCVGK